MNIPITVLFLRLSHSISAWHKAIWQGVWFEIWRYSVYVSISGITYDGMTVWIRGVTGGLRQLFWTCELAQEQRSGNFLTKINVIESRFQDCAEIKNRDSLLFWSLRVHTWCLCSGKCIDQGLVYHVKTPNNHKAIISEMMALDGLVVILGSNIYQSHYDVDHTPSLHRP